MKRTFTACVALSVGLALIMFWGSRSAHAVPEFAKAFLTKYVGDKNTKAQQELAADVESVQKCNVCHDSRLDDSGKKKSKKFHNPYGQALKKLIHKEDKKNTEKIMKALETVEKEKAEGAKETYGERLSHGQVPFKYGESAN